MELSDKIKIMLEEKEQKRAKRQAQGDYFNIFELCKIAEKENTHSNIIANLLDPGWKHGQGNIFLKRFCERLDIPFESAAATTVVREEVIPDRRPDIVIRNGCNLIVIENKTGTCDHENQLQDYWNWMFDESNENIETRTLIYLTKNGEHPRCQLEIEYYKPQNKKNVSSCTVFGKNAQKFILLPYSEIRDWCAHCSITPGVPECVADAFKQYANFLELWLNNETDDSDIIEFCAQEENLEAVNEIFYDNKKNEVVEWINDNYDQIIKTYVTGNIFKLLDKAEVKPYLDKARHDEITKRIYSGIQLTSLQVKIFPWKGKLYVKIGDWFVDGCTLSLEAGLCQKNEKNYIFICLKTVNKNGKEVFNINPLNWEKPTNNSERYVRLWEIYDENSFDNVVQEIDSIIHQIKSCCVQK